ncbi:MAG: GNAT family N-acetyltransferase [Planctomycetota bacterium]
MALLRATPTHLDALVPLFDGYRVFYGQKSDPERARKFLQDRFEQQDTVLFLATAEDGTPQGFTHLFPMFTSVGTARVWLLNDLFVAPNARRCGVARALMDHAATFARADGARSLELATQKENHAAKALYLELGYQLDEEYHHFALDLGIQGS